MIKEATLKDLKELTELNKEVQDLHNLISPKKFKPSNECNPQELFTEILNKPKAKIFIAYQDNNAAGYILCQEKSYEETPCTYGYTCLFINQISVNSKFRGHGIGRKLIEKATAYAKSQNYARVELDVWTQNENAKGFFKKVGFESFNKKMSIDL